MKIRLGKAQIEVLERQVSNAEQNNAVGISWQPILILLLILSLGMGMFSQFKSRSR